VRVIRRRTGNVAKLRVFSACTIRASSTPPNFSLLLDKVLVGPVVLSTEADRQNYRNEPTHRAHKGMNPVAEEELQPDDIGEEQSNNENVGSVRMPAVLEFIARDVVERPFKKCGNNPKRDQYQQPSDVLSFDLSLHDAPPIQTAFGCIPAFSGCECAALFLIPLDTFLSLPYIYFAYYLYDKQYVV
jgi:hypothetical protein